MGETPSGVDAFFEMALDHVAVAGKDGYFKRLSPSWTKTLGFTAEELMSRPLIEFVHPDDREETLAGRERLLAGGVMGPAENRYRCKEGGWRWFEWRASFNSEHGLVYAVARDVTDQKVAEASLREAQQDQEIMHRQLVLADRMASIGTLAAGAAHEINNPLAYVMANIALLREGLQAIDQETTPERLSELRAQLDELVGEAQVGAERIENIVQGLKTFSRLEEERRQVLEVIPLLELASRMTFNEIRHRARLVKEYGEIPCVNVDGARMGQVFINLLVNAAQAVPEGDSEAHEIRITTSTDDEGRAVIEISDTGAGIPAHVLERIFDPFFTTKAVGVGTGLGLSICHNLVARVSGQISARSVEGQGATFRIALPAAEPSQQEPVAPAAPPPPPPVDARATVLVVDDEPTIRMVLVRVLRGHEVTAVETAREALALLAAGHSFDVIFTDLMMPEMSGMDFYQELSRSFPALLERVVFVSGGAFTTNADAFLESVANVCIRKPFDNAVVRELVGRRLAARGRR